MRGGPRSTDGEPALGGAPPSRDPAERTAEPGEGRREGELLRDDVGEEPALRGAGPAREGAAWRAHVERRRAGCSPAASLALGAALALAAGPVALLGTFVAVAADPTVVASAVLVGPVIEEWMKQFAMVLLIERLPWRVLGAWQIPATAAFAGLGFAALENLLYLRVYLVHLPPEELAEVAAYRWTGCVALHVVCALIGSAGVVRAWRARSEGGGTFDLDPAFRWLAVAAALHGLHNLAALLLEFAGIGLSK